jgi:hypothetical protein
VTVLDIPLCRRREPQRTGARCPSSHRPQVRTFSATSTLNTASPKSARCALVSVSSPCTRCQFRVAPVARPPTFAQMRTHTPEGSNPSALPVQPHTHVTVRTLTFGFCTCSCDPHRHRTRVCVGEPHLAPSRPALPLPRTPTRRHTFVPRSHQTRGRTILAALILITSRP